MSALFSGAVRSGHPRTPKVVGGIVAALLLAHFCVFAEANPVCRKNLSDLLLVLDCSFSCLFMALAARRSTGSERVFWLLFTASIMVWAVTDTIWLARSLYQVHTPPPPFMSFGYRFYAVPLAVMLLRREQHSGAEPQFIALDWIQTSLVVGLIFAGLLYFPLEHATEQTQAARSQAIADVMNLALLAIALLRRHNESRLMRRLYAYLIWFLLAYTVVTFFANRQQFFAESAPLADVSWSVPSLLPGAMAAAWKSTGQERVRPAPSPPVFRELMTENLLASTLVLGVAVLSDHLPGSGHDWGNVAVAISLFSYSLRLTLLQHREQQESTHLREVEFSRRSALKQLEELLADSETRQMLLERTHELVGFLQVCGSEDDTCALIGEALSQMLPGYSGIVETSPSPYSTRHGYARWGPDRVSEACRPELCWQARKGRPSPVLTHICNSGVPDANTGRRLCIPMVSNGQSLGALTIVAPCDEAVFDPHSTAYRAATTVAEYVTPVIVNLRLRLALHEQATRDPLTGLFNRRYLEETLGREIRRSARNQRTVSVLMLDVDHFKAYNDRYGHDAGDAVLRAIGEMLSQRVRTEDIACRYGGEEFALILPDTPLSVASERAEQIRTGLQRMELKYSNRNLDPITVSIGLACSTAEIHAPAGVLKSADEALYRAKQEGRNRVCIAPPARRALVQTTNQPN